MASEPDRDREALLWRCVVDLAGGADTAKALADHHGGGVTITRLARERGVSKSTMHRRMIAMRGTLGKYGLLPATWEH